MSGLPNTVAAPDAPIATGDVTRRWVIAFPDGDELFPGVTPTEAADAAPVLAARAPVERTRALVVVVLPVLLSDGAGPHMLDARGRLVLALAEHPALTDLRIAMGPVAGLGPEGSGEQIGLVAAAGHAVFEWVARCETGTATRAACLDELDACVSRSDVAEWEGRWG